MDPTQLLAALSRQWDDEIVPQLIDYIRIPAKSPDFDTQCESGGHIERAIRLAEAWAKKQLVRGLSFEIVRLAGRTPLLYFPGAQFRITRVPVPHDIAHGPNELLTVPYAKELSACVALVLAAHAQTMADS